METNGAIPFKFYLIQEELGETEIRRFLFRPIMACSFDSIYEKVVELFPKLKEKIFQILWKDDDEDEICISSDNELIIALTTMKSEVKKLYIKIKNGLNGECSKKSRILHPLVYCDGCNKNIKGFRYKCIVCKDYDLCSVCEQMTIHMEHPMLRIPDPEMFDHITIFRLGQILSSFLATKCENSKHHSHHNKEYSESNPHSKCHKKKRKYEKFESGQDSNNSENRCHRKHCLEKWKKLNHCTYKAVLDEFWNLLNPVDFQTSNSETTKKSSEKENTEEKHHAEHLKISEQAISSFFNSLGIKVDIEVQPKSSEEEKNKLKTIDSNDKLPSDTNLLACSEPEEEIATTSKDKISIKGKNEETTTVLENKKSNESPEKDDWVSFEDLKNEVEAMSSSYFGVIPKNVKPTNTVTFNINKNEETQVSSFEENRQPEKGEAIYPNLNSLDFPKDPKIREALGKMLSMGFTNDGGWLTQLLEYKKGDINQVLEVLTPHKEH